MIKSFPFKNRQGTTMTHQNDTYILLVMADKIIKRKKPSKLLPHSTFMQVKISTTAQLEQLFNYFPEIYRVHIGQYIEDSMPFEKEEPVHGVLKRKIDAMPKKYGEIVFTHKFSISYGLLGKGNFEPNHKTRLHFIDIESARAFKEIAIDFTKSGEYPDAEKFNTTIKLKWREAKLRKSYVLSNSNMEQYLLKSPQEVLKYLGLNRDEDTLITKSSGHLLKGYDDRWHVYVMCDEKISNKYFQQTFLPELLKKRDPLSQFYVLNTLGDKMSQPRWLLVDINKLNTPGIFELCGLDNVAYSNVGDYKERVSLKLWSSTDVVFDATYKLRINARKELVANAFSDEDVERIKAYRAGVLDGFRKKVTQWVIAKFNKNDIGLISSDEIESLRLYIKKVYGLKSVEMLAFLSVWRTSQVNRTEGRLDKKFSEWGGKEYQEFIRSESIPVYSLSGHKICEDLKELPLIGYRGNIRNPFDFVDGGWNDGQVWSDGRGVLYNFGGSANWEKIIIPLYEKPKFLSETEVESENNPVGYSTKKDDDELSKLVIGEDSRGYIKNDDMEKLYGMCGDALCVLDVPTGKGKTFSVMKTFRPVENNRAVIFLVPTNTLAIDIFQSYHLYANVYLSKEEITKLEDDLAAGKVKGKEAKLQRKLLKNQRSSVFDFSKVVVMTYDKFKGELQGRFIAKYTKDISSKEDGVADRSRLRKSQLSSSQYELFEDDFYEIMQKMTRGKSWQFVFDEFHKVVEIKSIGTTYDATKDLHTKHSVLRKNTFYNDICKLSCKAGNGLGVLAMSATIHLDDILNIAVDDSLVKKYMIKHKFNDTRYVHFVYSLRDSVESGRVGSRDKGLFMFETDPAKMEELHEGRKAIGRKPILIHGKRKEYKNLSEKERLSDKLDVFINTAAQEGVSIIANDNIKYGLINLVNGGNRGQSPRDIVQISNRVRSGDVYMDVLCSGGAFNLGLEWLDIKADNVFELLESEKTWKDIYFEFLDGIAEWRDNLIRKYSNNNYIDIGEHEEGIIRISASALDYIMTMKTYIPSLLSSEVDKFVVILSRLSISSTAEYMNGEGVMKVMDAAINAWVISVRDRYASNSFEVMAIELKKYGVILSVDIIEDIIDAIDIIANGKNNDRQYREWSQQFIAEWNSCGGRDIKQKSKKYELYDALWRRMVAVGVTSGFIKNIQKRLSEINKQSKKDAGLESVIDMRVFNQLWRSELDNLNQLKYKDKCTYVFGLLVEDALDILEGRNTDIQYALRNILEKCKNIDICRGRLENTINRFREMEKLCKLHRSNVIHLDDLFNSIKSYTQKKIKRGEDAAQSIFKWIKAHHLYGYYTYMPIAITDKYSDSVVLHSNIKEYQEIRLEYTELALLKTLFMSETDKVNKVKNLSNRLRYTLIHKKGVGVVNIVKFICDAIGLTYRDYTDRINKLIEGHTQKEYEKLIVCDRYKVEENEEGREYIKCHDIEVEKRELSKKDIDTMFLAYRSSVLGNKETTASNLKRNFNRKGVDIPTTQEIKEDAELRRLGVVNKLGIRTVKKIEILKKVLWLEYSKDGSRVFYRGSFEDKMLLNEAAQLRVNK